MLCLKIDERLFGQEHAAVPGVGFVRGSLSSQSLTRRRSSLHCVRGPGHLSRIEPTYLAADTAAMAKKSEPAQPIRWDIYRAGAKARPVGAVEAADEDLGDREGRQGVQGHHTS
jgi:hypothetical protein